MNKTEKLCYHPEWPYHMTKPGNIWECDCGGNFYCNVCGFGRRVMPCDCDRTRAIVDKYLTRFAPAWKEMAMGEKP